MTALTELDEAGFEGFVRGAGKPVLVDFHAPWCGPCRALAPTLEAMAADLGDQIAFAKLNVDEAPRLAASLGVRSIPALILFVDGEPLDTRVGQRSRGEIAQWLVGQLVEGAAH
jgi:thioredoxin 1